MEGATRDGAIAIYWTQESGNRKIGPMPVSTTERASCAPSCPFLGKGCYAEGYPTRGLWDDLSEHGANASWRSPQDKVMRSTDWSGLCRKVAALDPGTVWRHNQAGDLPHRGGKIDRKRLRQLTRANRGRRGFTFCHHVVLGDSAIARHNRACIAEANAGGFTVNLSANSVSEVAALTALGIGPVVVVLPAEQEGKRTQYVDDVAVTTCPATYSDVQCRDCQLCARGNRRSVPGFPAHGNAKRKASAIAQG